MTQDQKTPKELFEKSNLPYIYFILRPLGKILIPVFIKIGTSPNQVSILSIFISIIGIIFISMGNLSNNIIGVIVLQIGLVLDMTDGDLARRLGKTSLQGELLDSVGGFLRGAILMPAIGISIYLSAENKFLNLNEITELQPYIYIYIGMITSVLILLSRIISLKYKSIINKPFRESTNLLSKLSLHFEDLMNPLLIICALTKTFNLLLIGYFIYYLMALIYTILSSYRKSANMS